MSAVPTRLTQPLTITVETITPEMAAKFLENVRNPRSLRPAKVKVYAADMLAGRWATGSSSLKFDPSGALRDGQHRLAACLESGIPFVSVIFWNVSEDAIDNTDRGMARQWCDVLAGRGVQNTRQIQAIVNLAWRWDRGELLKVYGSRATPTVGEADAWLEEHPMVMAQVPAVVRITKAVGGRASVIGSFLYRVSTIDLDARDRLVETFITGANLTVDSPLRRLRDRVMSDRLYRSYSGHQAQMVELAVMCKTWNLWLLGKETKQLGFRPSVEQFPDLVDGDGRVVLFPDVVARGAKRR